MLDRLPELIDPLSFADKHSELSGQIKLKSLSRLAPLLKDDAGVATVELFFSRHGRLASIEGKIAATLNVACQNCLNAMDLHIENNIKLGIVNSLDEADRLPEDYEPLLVGEGKIPLKDIVEDELLLALPDFPRHSEACFRTETSIDRQDSLDVEQSNSNNPFSILAKLKHTGVK
ncbi:YceD family protein [Methylotuvimicrobium buryatense]|uniref:Large ribosomal RNA subunit accumulation protein YceD n=1 Tax=Methylotuvimicrobium buryatense TaxID=95641 RepID=A0A4P9UMU9_METBY|nr:YceD family protein [Methylotuvimicrobium buryatense]QCW82598.1 metal-binding protein [Methylotuvimicrobium buryatense]